MDNMLAALRSPEYWSAVGQRANKLALMPESAPYGQGMIPAEQDLSKMSWPDLYALRSKLKSREEQNAVAPYEHRAYTREFTGSPKEALQNFLSTALYTPYKAAVGNTRSDPSLKQIGYGMMGIYEGLRK